VGFSFDILSSFHVLFFFPYIVFFSCFGFLFCSSPYSTERESVTFLANTFLSSISKEELCVWKTSQFQTASDSPLISISIVRAIPVNSEYSRLEPPRPRRPRQRKRRFHLNHE
jgi:hypothetical protein